MRTIVVMTVYACVHAIAPICHSRPHVQAATQSYYHLDDLTPRHPGAYRVVLFRLSSALAPFPLRSVSSLSLFPSPSLSSRARLRLHALLRRSSFIQQCPPLACVLAADDRTDVYLRARPPTSVWPLPSQPDRVNRRVNFARRRRRLVSLEAKRV